MSETQLRCPACGRWLGEVAGYAKLVCAYCGAETTYRSKQNRAGGLTDARPVPRLLATKSAMGPARR